MTDLLFTYGTLISGMEPSGMSDLVKQMTLLGPATTRGRLYDLGEYPGLLIDGYDSEIRGRIVRVPEDLWDALDAYEACPLPGSTEGLFRRVKTTAIDANRQSVDCWVYVYNEPVGDAPVVECGCWLTYRSQSKLRP